MKKNNINFKLTTSIVIINEMKYLNFFPHSENSAYGSFCFARYCCNFSAYSTRSSSCLS